MILPHLENLTKRGWWTVGSQPAVNGASSTDDIVGWGPRAGYVFQKCFVEFFCEEKDVNAISKRTTDQGNGWIHFFACNNEVFSASLSKISKLTRGWSQGKCISNVLGDGRNAVTWGVFPGKEIIQTTIIERESFMSWKVYFSVKTPRSVTKH